MEKKIEDYLSLYIGCEIIGRLDDEPRKGYLTGISGVAESPVEIQFFTEDGVNVSEEPEYNRYEEVKPILKQLSDMTDTDGMEIMNKCYESVFDHVPVYDFFINLSQSEGGGFRASEIVNDKRWDYGLTVTDKGIDFSSNGDFLIVPQFHLFKFLINAGYDMFGLIESGLAIDESQKKNKIRIMTRLTNIGNVQDIKSSLELSEYKFSVSDLEAEIEFEKKGKNRSTVIKMINAAIKRKIKNSNGKN